METPEEEKIVTNQDLIDQIDKLLIELDKLEAREARLEPRKKVN